MAKSGDELEHPVTGERMVWRQFARDTNGELIGFDLFAEPGGHPAAAHVHPNQEDTGAAVDSVLGQTPGGQSGGAGL